MLGKGQEVTRLLTAEGIPVLQHRDIFAVSQVYEACGVSLGRYERFTGRGRSPAGPSSCRRARARSRRLGRQVRIAVTGWAADRAGEVSAGRGPCRAALRPRRLRRVVRGRRAGRAAGGLLHARAGEFRRSAPRRRLRRPSAGPTQPETAVLRHSRRSMPKAPFVSSAIGWYSSQLRFP